MILFAAALDVLAAVFVVVGLLLLGTLAVPLVRGMWFRLFPPRPRRDVPPLDGEQPDLDLTQEAIDDEGQPLKPGHCRRILRDPRLLPKAPPPENVWPRPKRVPLLSADDARRLFSATLRTRNRRIRDLLPDERQLAELGLPLWRTEADIAAALEISLGQLRHFSIHRHAETQPHYVAFTIAKRNGQPRTILAPKRRLKALQRKLLALLVEKLPVSPHAHGFRAGRSIRSGAGPHVGKQVVLKLDLRDFFPTVTFARLRGLLIAAGYGYPVAAILAVLMTEAERQPVALDERTVHVPVGPRHCVQGAPTSPGVCNAICRRLDHRLAGAAKKYGWTFTRYADDLTFSGNAAQHLLPLRRLAQHICREEGFLVNAAKTRVLRRGRRQTVTGVVVNDAAGLSRQQRRRLRAVIHRLNGNSPDVLATLTPTQLRGKLAYLHMLNPEQAASLQKRIQPT